MTRPLLPEFGPVSSSIFFCGAMSAAVSMLIRTSPFEQYITPLTTQNIVTVAESNRFTAAVQPHGMITCGGKRRGKKEKKKEANKIKHPWTKSPGVSLTLLTYWREELHTFWDFLSVSIHTSDRIIGEIK